MISPTQFASAWRTVGFKLVKFTTDHLSGFALSNSARRFLLDSGLPDGAAPFLTFRASKAGPLPTASSSWKLSPAFDRYREIGFEGSGDPICIDTSNGSVVHLQHDGQFVPVFMNSSVPQLAECLLEYRRFWQETSDLEDAGATHEVLKSAETRLLETLGKIDPAAVAAGCFWSHAAAMR